MNDTNDPSGFPAVSPEDERDIFKLLDEFPTGLVLLDERGTVLRVNGAAAECLGATPLGLLGRNLFTGVLPDLERVGVAERYREEIRAGSVSFDWKGDRSAASGPHETISFRSIRLQGRTWGLAVVESSRADVGSDLQKKRAERLSVVSELAAGIAHEVNNPLASIRSLAQLLVRDLLTVEQHRALDLIVLETARIARSVENLHSFARQQGAMGRESVDLNRITGEILEELADKLSKSGVTLERDLDMRITPVFGEISALREVVRELILNANQALAEVAGDRAITIRTRESTDGVILSVVDNGPGIRRELLDQIFTGYRANSDGRICLGVVAAIVREHGGSIWAESEPGGGSTFFIRLPRAAAIAVDEAPDAEHEAAVDAASEEKLPKPLRVLIADDEPTLRLAISLYLARRGHKVTLAEDAYEARRLVEDNEFDVALVDARMPGDGLQLLEHLDGLPGLRGRTALMTGDLGRARSNSQTLNERPCLSKPFDMEEAVALLEALGEKSATFS